MGPSAINWPSNTAAAMLAINIYLYFFEKILEDTSIFLENDFSKYPSSSTSRMYRFFS